MSALDALARAAHLLGWILIYTPPPPAAPLGAGLAAIADPRGGK